MTAELVCRALNMTVKSRGQVAQTMCHFDRGSQDASDVFQALLHRCGFTCSISRKGNCWKNAVAESFFHSLRVEAVHGITFRTKDEARRAVFDWIECFYNTNRRHSALGYLSPAETVTAVSKHLAHCNYSPGHASETEVSEQLFVNCPTHLNQDFVAKFITYCVFNGSNA